MPERALQADDPDFEVIIVNGGEPEGVRRVALEDPEHHLWRIRNILDYVAYAAAGQARRIRDCNR